MKSLTRVFLLLTVLLVAALPADASCTAYFCDYSYDTATCSTLGWARRLTTGTSCEVVSSCIYHYSEAFGWTVDCSYSCSIDECYAV